jgi:membrane-associated protease RseP (regulator of RpoE activity)
VPAAGGLSATATSSTSIRQWIKELSSDDFGTREAATQNLTRAGRAALSEVAAAAQQDDLEVTTRAVSLLRSLLMSGDGETEEAAATALEQVAKAQVTSSAGQAADILRSYSEVLEQRAIHQLRQLGAVVQIGNPRTGQADCQQVVLGVSWHGRISDLSLLKRVSDLEYLGFHGIPLTDDDLPTIMGLARLDTLELFGTRVTEAGVERLRLAYPGTRIDRRSNAMLGVRGGVNAGMCQIDEVQSGTAAERAGLMAGDVVLKFQGHPVADFDQLTVQIANCRAGDNVIVQVRRGEETLDKPVTLGEWR